MEKVVESHAIWRAQKRERTLNQYTESFSQTFNNLTALFRINMDNIIVQ